jgi:hypothetical protein
MDKNKLKIIISDIKNQTNKDLLESLEFLSSEHEILKNDLLEKTKYLDEITNIYNTILTEYKLRNKK